MLNVSFLLRQSWWIQLALLFTVLSTRAILIAGGSSLWIRFSAWAKARRIVAGENSPQVMVKEITNGFLVIFLDASSVVLLIKAGVFHFSTEFTALEFITTYVAMFIWGEIYFYYSHRLFHIPTLFWIHRHHHQSAVVNPWTSLAFSIPERLLLLLGLSVVPALISFWYSIPLPAFALYFLVNYALNVYGHLNTEVLPPSYAQSWFGRILNTTSYHTMHHQRYRGHYGLFTPFLDQWHATRYADYESVQAANFQKGALREETSLVME